MKYNPKYDLYIDEDLVIYYWSKKYDKLMQRTLTNNNGYLICNTRIGTKGVHQIIYETFVGPIPEGMEIDHINTIRSDNRLENLRCVTHRDNQNNPISCIKRRRTMKGKSTHKGIITSEFGRKFKEHYGILRHQDIKLYKKEHWWYKHHNYKCRWE